MKVKIEGLGELKFWFEHNPEAYIQDKEKTKASTVVFCELDGYSFFGCAWRVKSDAFCKATGRRAALTRLLRDGLLRVENLLDGAHKWVVVHKFTREQREKIWFAYFAQHRDLSPQAPTRPKSAPFFSVADAMAEADRQIKESIG